MDSTAIILFLCTLVIISYLFEIIAKKSGIPAVLFLIILGIALNRLAPLFTIPAIDFQRLIPVIGTVGLILIVFEGALEIEYHPDKRVIFLNALAVSVALLIANSIILSLIISRLAGHSFYISLINAIPLSIISSAIAIPSAAYLSPDSREFITLESSLSDILGIIFFNYAITNSYFSFGIAGKITIELVIVIAVSLIFCLFLIYLLRSIGHNIKFILILTVMVLLYALGKSIHVSSLIMVLMFGLLLKNINLARSEFIQKHFNNLDYMQEFSFLQQITAEGVFLIKTFFFIIFGYIIHPQNLLIKTNIITAVIVTCVIFGVRLLTLLVLRRKIFPEIFYAPRGLISILLFLSIPSGMTTERINIDVIFLVIIISSIIMVIGSFWKVPGTQDEATQA